MQVDDLFTKIGILTVENDMLRAELKKLNERIAELESQLASVDEKAEEPPAKKG